MQCPICKYHIEHIFTVEISPLTNQRWRIERCPHCNHAFDLELERDYQSRKHKDSMDKPDPRRPLWYDDNDKRGWHFGV